MSLTPASSGKLRGLSEDLVKIPAFFRRDLLILWSYRTAFFSDWVNMLVQVMVFYFLSAIVPTDRLPEYGGQPTTYIQFVTVGIALTAFVSISLGRVTSAVSTEQNQGTLEALLMTPTASSTIQLGWVVYDLLYVPLRTAVFLLLMSLLLGVTLSPAGILPTVVMFIPFIPFIWGLGRHQRGGHPDVPPGSGPRCSLGCAPHPDLGCLLPDRVLPTHGCRRSPRSTR